ncbi:Hint domain-containing protein [Roseicyclus persicicus]|uniref:Hedgehog/Intein (Hint) domain-containing protein n=1 Tax=Roseicyclus persicicus TaxID=2650661 RepID=A0A7X6H1S4_9RHOB|nr:hypothetical protein [Roseibacterium persicicum]
MSWAAQGAADAAVEGRWCAIWRAGVLVAPLRPVDALPRPELTLCLEFTLPPLPRRVPLRLWQGAAEASRAIGLYALPDGALRLVHGEIDLVTPPGTARPGETVTLRYRACARGRGDIADFINHDRPLRHRLRAGLARAARLDEALPREAGFLSVCHVAAVAEFGLAPTDLPALATGAMLPTSQGMRPVEALEPGMVLRTVTGERLPLRWVARRPRLCLGRLAPVRLRAPYFGLAQDICVTPETRILRSGPAVEYLFGHEKVLVRAGDLTGSPGAHPDRNAPVRVVHHLMLDDPACVTIDRCGVETALLSDVVAAEDAGPPRNLSDADRQPCLPVLDRAAAQALVAASARGRRAAG